MTNLLRSNFRRLFKNKLLYIGALAVFIADAGTLFNNLYFKDMMLGPGVQLNAGSLFFSGTTVACIAIAAFLSFFVGTEYSDGTFRNKIIAGKGRMEIYLSYLIVTSVAALLMFVMGSGVVLAAGIPLLGGIGSVSVVLPQIMCCLLSLIALNALVLAMSMMISSKPIAIIVGIVMVLLLVSTVPIELSSSLHQEPIVEAWSYTDENGVLHEVEAKENPKYVTGTKRVFLQFCYDAVPTCQIYQYHSQESPANLKLFPLYSVLWIIGVSACGIVVFQKRNIK